MQGTRSTSSCRPCAATTAAKPGPAPSNWTLMLTGVGFLALVGLAVLTIMAMTSMMAHAGPLATDPAPARQQELIHLVRQECGFCHGLRLTGGLGSPLTAEAMREKPAETLEAVIRHGIPGTAMPGWAPFLTEPETRWIVRALQQGFPNDR